MMWQRYKVLTLNRPGLVLIVFAFLLANTLVAQETAKPKNPYSSMTFKERLFFGGDFGLSFGDFTFVRIAPIVGYNVSPKFAVGLGPNYQYWRIRYRFPQGTQTIENQIIGGSTFIRWFAFESFFLQSDFEFLNLRSGTRDPGNYFDEQVVRVNVPIWLVGAGYVQRSGRSGFFVGAFYDLIQDRNSPYGTDIIIRAGMFF